MKSHIGKAKHAAKELDEIILQQRESLRKKECLIKELKRILMDIAAWNIPHPKDIGKKPDERTVASWASNDLSDMQTAKGMARWAYNLKEENF